MKNYLLLLVSFLLVPCFSQAQSQPLRGQVTYLTSRNVYVTFDRTDEIAVGDTLHLASSQGACLLVTNKSSSSCVCVSLGDCAVEKGDAIVYFSKQRKPSVPEPAEIVEEEAPQTVEEQPISRPVEVIRGRFLVSQYSNIASDRDDRHRLMSSFSLNANHVNHSRFSFESFLTYRHIFPTDKSQFAPNTSFFRVYNLALSFEATPTLNLMLGRRINPKISSLGAIDGLQVEKFFGNTYLGAIAGSRPDIFTHAVDPNLLQYGGYVGQITQHKQFRSQTSLGAIEQRNQGQVDRRYAYFQHSSTIGRQLTLFSSVEMDLYQSINGVKSADLRLSNLFVSAMYRFGRKVNLTLSYDSRKRILYYETFQSDIERLLDDDLARQGIRARINVRPIKHVSLGGSYSNRFQSDTQNKSDNLYAYATWSRVAGIGGRLTASYNQNSSNYLTSNIIAGRYSRGFLKEKLNTEAYYRYVTYTFVNSANARPQHYLGTSLSYRFTRTLALSMSGELAIFNGEQNYRIYTRLVKRLYRKRE